MFALSYNEFVLLFAAAVVRRNPDKRLLPATFFSRTPTYRNTDDVWGRANDGTH
jgi:hypothetical protein